MKTRIIKKHASTTQPSFAQMGLTTVEYVIILALIAVMSYAAWSKFGGQLKDRIGKSEATIFDGAEE